METMAMSNDEATEGDTIEVVLDDHLPRDASVGGVSVSLHPLPIISMSEHITRTVMQTGNQRARTVGALVGTQTGRDVDIHTTFEFLLEEDDASIDQAFFESRQNQFKQVFPTFDVLGWYSNGAEPTPLDLKIHRQILAYNESALFLQLSPSPDSLNRARAAGELPIAIFETHVDAASRPEPTEHKGPRILFKPTKYRIETGEAERIAVDHASKPVANDEGGRSTLIASLTTQYNATKMLSDRIAALNTYVKNVKQGKVARDHESLRQISSLVASLPASGLVREFESEFSTEYNDLLLTNFLSDLTGNLSNLNELVDKYDVAQSSSDDRFGGGAAGASRMKGTRGAAKVASTGWA